MAADDRVQRSRGHAQLAGKLAMDFTAHRAATVLTTINRTFKPFGLTVRLV